MDPRTVLPVELIELQRLLVGRYSRVRELGRGGMPTHHRRGDVRSPC